MIKHGAITVFTIFQFLSVKWFMNSVLYVPFSSAFLVAFKVLKSGKIITNCRWRNISIAARPSMLVWIRRSWACRKLSLCRRDRRPRLFCLVGCCPETFFTPFAKSSGTGWSSYSVCQRWSWFLAIRHLPSKSLLPAIRWAACRASSPFITPAHISAIPRCPVRGGGVARWRFSRLRFWAITLIQSGYSSIISSPNRFRSAVYTVSRHCQRSRMRYSLIEVPIFHLFAHIQFLYNIVRNYKNNREGN